MAALFRLVDAASGQTVVEQLTVADTFFSRLVGLQFQPRLSPQKGLLIVPCRSIHTCCVRFPLDLAMLDHQGNVLQIARGVPPWRCVAGPRETFAVLEMAAECLKLEVGQRLQLQALDAGTPMPARLRHWATTEAR